MTIHFAGNEHKNMIEAYQDIDASGYECAIIFAGKYIATTDSAAQTLLDDGFDFAYICYHKQTNQCVTIPAR